MINKLTQSLVARPGQSGVTLVELMVSLALGAFLVLGVVNVFMSTKESSQLESALARVQENGRFALDILADDIRRAHYAGCNSVKRNIILKADDVSHLGIRGYTRASGSWSETLDADDEVLTTLDSSTVRDGTDLLNLHIARRMGSDLLVADVEATDTTISLKDNPGCLIEPGDVVAMSSCLTAHVIRVNPTPSTCDPTTVTPTVLTFTADNDGDPIEPGYRTGRLTEVMSFESVAWYIADTGRDRNGLDVYALYRKSLNNAAEEMIEGVEFMRILYGQRNDSTGVPATRFVSAVDADLKDNWGEVVSARIGLLVQSYELVRDTDDTRTYILADPAVALGSSEHGGGRVLRKAFRTTVALRNTDFDT